LTEIVRDHKKRLNKKNIYTLVWKTDQLVLDFILMVVQVAVALTKRALPEAVVLVRAILWLLSTRIGTLLLCGSVCLGKEWPFITQFKHLPIERREKVLQNWSSSRFFSPIRLVFYLLKTLCLYFFFSLVNFSTLE